MPRRVRIVEDNEDIAFMFGSMLEGAHVHVEFTTSDFASLLAPEPWEEIDVAVCDLMLGAVEGQTILRYLREAHPHIRRVAMTAALAEGIEATGLANQVLIKPFSVADLLDAIK